MSDKEYRQRPEVKARRAKKAREARAKSKEPNRKAHRKYILRTKFGLTVSQYQAMLQTQDGKCAICGSPSPEKELSVDHCHQTGKVRGLLCNPCNIGIGYMYDDPIRLLSAVKYLLRYK